MAAMQNALKAARSIWKPLISAVLVIIGFVLVFFTTQSKMPKAFSSLTGYDDAGVAHADIPGDASAGLGVSGGGDSGSGDSSGDCG